MILYVEELEPRLVPSRYNVLDYGAVADGKYADDVRITAGSTQLTSSSADFSPADVGKTIWVLGAGGQVNEPATNTHGPYTGYDPLEAAIVAVNSATSVTLSNAALTTAGPNNPNYADAGHATWGTDNTAALQAAINAAASAGGGSVYVPAGTYAIFGEYLDIASSNVRLHGDGPRSVIYQGGVATSRTSYDTDDGDGIVLVGSTTPVSISSIEIDHLYLKNAGTVVHDPINGVGVIDLYDYNTVSNAYIHDNIIYTASRVGIGSGAVADHLVIQRNDIYGGIHGLYLAGNGASVLVTRNVLINLPSLYTLGNSQGMSIKRHTNFTISYNAVRNYANDIAFDEAFLPGEGDGIVSDNTVDNTGLLGVLPANDIGIKLLYGSDLRVDRNAVVNCSNFGIYVGATVPMDHLSIKDNHISWSSDSNNSTSSGIAIGSFPSGTIADVSLVGNLISNAGSYGIHLNGVQGINTIAHNTVQRPMLLATGVGFRIVNAPPRDSNDLTSLIGNTTVNFPTESIDPNVVQKRNHFN